ncbi:MAG: hypothetical protein J7L55_02160 [Desulfurococcales archaeon]|nr:hypothetical protein [Desulfurococcales archaeon]
MGIEVTVVTNGSPLGEELVRIAWATAQKLFQDYGIEVYVIPYQTKGRVVALVINGLEIPVTRPLSREELTNIILSAASSEGKWEDETVLGATAVDDGSFGNGVVVYA